MLGLKQYAGAGAAGPEHPPAVVPSGVNLGSSRTCPGPRPSKNGRQSLDVAEEWPGRGGGCCCFDLHTVLWVLCTHHVAGQAARENRKEDWFARRRAVGTSCCGGQLPLFATTRGLSCRFLSSPLPQPPQKAGAKVPSGWRKPAGESVVGKGGEARSGGGGSSKSTGEGGITQGVGVKPQAWWNLFTPLV